MLNGKLFTYEDPNGWTLGSASEIELLGEACEEIMNGGDDQVLGEFPYDAIIN